MFKTIRTHWTTISAALALGTLLSMGGVALAQELDPGCCALGAECCRPGAACCNHAKHSAKP